MAGRLTEDQANGVLAGLRPDAINAMPLADRASLLNALASRPDARVFTLVDAGPLFKAATGPLTVVAGGLVLWHATDVAFAPDERVTERPDGTVVRERTGVASKAVEVAPRAARAVSDLLLWPAVIAASGLALVVAAVALRTIGGKRLEKIRPDELGDDKTVDHRPATAVE